MKHHYLFLLITTILMFNSVSYAEVSTDQQVINQKVWLPFIQGWKNMDAEQILELHSQDVIRIMERENKIEEGDVYLSKLQRLMSMMSKKGASSDIEFRFQSRVVDGNLAWERGVYKAVMSHPTRGLMTNYAEFSVVLIKTQGQWKILMDRDAPTNESAFEQLDQASAVKFESQ